MKKLNKMTQNKKVAASGYETATFFWVEDRSRTDDLLNHNQAL